ncbi:hypothetical protein ACK9YZ_25695 [Rhizobium sp. ZK1]|uniref:YobI family P-loop NTPase n=1 Tax=Rhizobium sp. ZK1 TaxID=3389872 RepID=UPI0039F683CD
MWKSLLRKSPQKLPVSKFVDLAPTRNAAQTGIYYETLEFATNNDEVLNTALTGSYGSGKSSVSSPFSTS